MENLFQEIDYILNFDCPEDVLVERLLDRGKTSGRADDNPESIRNRIKVFNSSTRPALDFYTRFGKVHTVSSTGTIEEVYSQVLKELQKNLIFLYGPPGIDKSNLAQGLSGVAGYRHLELKQLWRKGKGKLGEEEKVNMLMKLLETAGEQNIIIDGFFETTKQARIFAESFQRPSLVLYFDATKDFVDEQLILKQDRERELAYKEYVKNRKEILDYFRKDPAFVRLPVDKENPIDGYYNKIINQYLAPEVFFAVPDENPSLFQSYVEALERERGFIHLPLPQLLQQEAERRTPLGLEIAKHHPTEIPLPLQLALLSKILFRQQRKFRFLITGFPNDFAAYQDFEAQIREISYLITFPPEGSVAKVPFFCGQEPDFLPQTYFHSLGKHMVIDRNSLALFDYYTQKKNTYYLVFAPPYFERLLITKHLSEKFGMGLIEWEETITKLKEKLGGDDGAVDEVTFPQILKHFQDFFKAQPTKALVFDGFSTYGLQELEGFFKAVGNPKGVLSLEMTKESLIRAYRTNKGLELDAEIPEEELAELSQAREKHESVMGAIEKLAEEGFGTDFYKINANISMSTIKNTVEALFFKRVYLVSHSFPIYSEQHLDDKFLQIFANIAARYQLVFVDVRSLILKEVREVWPLFPKINSQYLMRWTEKPIDFPSNYTPDLIMELVKKHLAGLTIQSREIMLYNYSMGDYTHDRSLEECCFPRALDELAAVEGALGQIRMVISINQG